MNDKITISSEDDKSIEVLMKELEEILLKDEQEILEIKKGVSNRHLFYERKEEIKILESLNKDLKLENYDLTNQISKLEIDNTLLRDELNK